jgi:hypothetical protein
MTAEEIQKIVDRELNEPEEELKSWNEEEVRRLLLKPVKHTYLDTFEEDSTMELWLILDERPGVPTSQKIVYDENENEFGLAGEKDGQPVFLGYYGTLVETLESM